MSQNLILIPVFLQVLLTFAIMFAMGAARRQSMSERRKALQEMSLATDQDWTEDARKRANSYKNQFELPVLFYAVCAFALITRYVDPVMLVLASLFVLTRVAHAAVHIGSNVVIWRGSYFLAGFIVLAAMWLLLMWRVAAAGF